MKWLMSDKKKKKEKKIKEKKGKEKRLTQWILLFSFSWFMKQHSTRYTRYRSYNNGYRQHKDDMKKMTRKLYLQVILLISYMMEKTLSVYVK